MGGRRILDVHRAVDYNDQRINQLIPSSSNTHTRTHTVMSQSGLCVCVMFAKFLCDSIKISCQLFWLSSFTNTLFRGNTSTSLCTYVCTHIPVRTEMGD